jgi:hypothetical protein
VKADGLLNKLSGLSQCLGGITGSDPQDGRGSLKACGNISNDINLPYVSSVYIQEASCSLLKFSRGAF